MEDKIEKLFNEMMDRYRKEKHEFDAESTKTLHDVFMYAFEAGFDEGMDYIEMQS